MSKHAGLEAFHSQYGNEINYILAVAAVIALKNEAIVKSPMCRIVEREGSIYTILEFFLRCNCFVPLKEKQQKDSSDYEKILPILETFELSDKASNISYTLSDAETFATYTVTFDDMPSITPLTHKMPEYTLEEAGKAVEARKPKFSANIPPKPKIIPHGSSHSIAVHQPNRIQNEAPKPTGKTVSPKNFATPRDKIRYLRDSAHNRHYSHLDTHAPSL